MTNDGAASAPTSAAPRGTQLSASPNPNPNANAPSASASASPSALQGALEEHEEGGEMLMMEGSELEELAIKLLVPNNMVGSIIGKSGTTIKEITSQTGAKIHIAQGNEAILERMVTITGPLDQIGQAQLQISLKMLEEALTEFKDAQGGELPLATRMSLLPVKLLVPNAVIGRLIGKGGVNLKKTMVESNTYITCSKEDEFTRYLGDRIGDRIVSIFGSVENQNKTLVSVIFQLRQHSRNQLSRDRDPSPLVFDANYVSSGGFSGSGQGSAPAANLRGSSGREVDSFGYSAYPMRPQMQGYLPQVPAGGEHYGISPDLQDQEETLCVQVPNGVVGSIIGKKGATVKEISTLSGCSVRVARNEEIDINAATRPITLFGTIHSLFKAQTMIHSKITEAPPAVGGGPDQAFRVEITIPNDVVGRVIGKRGTQIRKIMEHSGSRISINQDEEDERNGTLVTIIGTLESNLIAQSRIFEILTYHNPSDQS